MMTVSVSLTMKLNRPSATARRSSSTLTRPVWSTNTQQPMEPLASAGTRSSHPSVVTETADPMPISQIGAQRHGASSTQTSAPRPTHRKHNTSQARASTTVTVSATLKIHSPIGTPTRRMMRKSKKRSLQPQSLKVPRPEVVP